MYCLAELLSWIKQGNRVSDSRSARVAPLLFFFFGGSAAGHGLSGSLFFFFGGSARAFGPGLHAAMDRDEDVFDTLPPQITAKPSKVDPQPLHAGAFRVGSLST
jgi:hypothetical protein